MTLFLELVAVAALVLLNGFFVGAEYSLVTVRRTRMEELRQEMRAISREIRKDWEVPES